MSSFEARKRSFKRIYGDKEWPYEEGIFGHYRYELWPGVMANAGFFYGKMYSQNLAKNTQTTVCCAINKKPDTIMHFLSNP